MLSIGQTCQGYIDEGSQGSPVIKACFAYKDRRSAADMAVIGHRAWTSGFYASSRGIRDTTLRAGCTEEKEVLLISGRAAEQLEGRDSNIDICQPYARHDHQSATSILQGWFRDS